MDISAFSNEDFDTKEWVNNILKQSETAKDPNYTMSLVMKLQLYVQQVNSALEDTSEQVLASLPKILRDVKTLQQEAVLLKEKMATVRTEVEKIEHDTGQSISTIEKLDTMQNKLIVAKQGLHESDNWTVLVNDLEEVFDSKNIENISNKIIGMQNSLKLLVNVPDYENRRLQLEELKNRLEAIASPGIVQAFNSHNTEQSQTFVQIFTSIHRLPELLKYYQKCQKDLLINYWRNQLEDDSALQYIHNFFNHLLSNWHTQYRWFNQVFTGSSALKNLTGIYTEVLQSLDPSLNQCIDATLSLLTVEDKLGFLAEVKQTTLQFDENLLNVVYENAQAKLYSEEILQLEKSIFAHLVTYVNKYHVFEQNYLLQRLRSLNCIKEELPDTIQSLGLSIPSVIDYCVEAKNRCIDFTVSCGFSGLLVALRTFLASYADFYRVAQRQIDRNKKSEEDWIVFQLCFSLLQHTGEVLLKLQTFEKDLTNQILECDQKKMAHYKILLLNESDLKEFDSLVRCVTEGTKLSLLDASTSEFVRLCSDIHHTTYQVVFAPISAHLDVVQLPDTWRQFDGLVSNDLPDYSFAPQEYITQIGQYLLILPQHLEPFLFNDNPSLFCALKSADQEYGNAVEGEKTLAQVFLTVIADGTCQYFVDKILAICELSAAASRQLAHDISYLRNILEELGLSLSENLQQLSSLLKIPAEQYQAQSSGCSARLVAAVRQMRNIKSANKQILK